MNSAVSALFGGSMPAALGGGIPTSSGYIMPIVLGFVGLLLVLMIVYIIIQSYKGRATTTLTGPMDLWNPSPTPVIVDRTVVRGQMSGTYTLSLFIKLDAIPDMRIAATPLLTFPGVWSLAYEPSSESLTLTFQETAAPASSLRIPEFPLQRWNQLTLTLEGRSVDVYINGKLATSTLLDNVPPSGNSSITIVPDSAMGSLAFVQVWGRRLTVSDVGTNYAATADSQGRPFLGNSLLAPLQNLSKLSVPNMFCPSGDCNTTAPTAQASQTWEFPYA